jgi:hypothetical protein
MKHSTDDCPAYHTEKMPEVMEGFKNLEAKGKELNVKQHYFVWCPPNHTAFLLLEADSLNDVSRYIFSIPFPHESKIVPVEHMQDTMAMAEKL